MRRRKWPNKQMREENSCECSRRVTHSDSLPSPNATILPSLHDSSFPGANDVISPLTSWLLLFHH